MPSAEYIGKNFRRVEAPIWQSWMDSAAHLANKFMKHDKDGDGKPIDPLSYNETASVSLLVAAAHRAGMVALAEYVTMKAAKDKRKRDRNGRADLWLCDCNDRHWEFEFKQPTAIMFGVKQLNAMMSTSRGEALSLLTRRVKLKARGVTPIAGRIFYAGENLETRAEQFDDLLKKFCVKGNFDVKIRGKSSTWVRHGWKVLPHLGSHPTYFIFDVMKKD
jgi:hypothetical protein